MVVGKRGRWPGHVRATRWLWPCVAALLGRARSDCEPWCTSPCAELNGQFEKECSDCVGDEFLCRPATFPASPNALPPTLPAAVRAEPSASIPPPEPPGPPLRHEFDRSFGCEPQEYGSCDGLADLAPTFGRRGAPMGRSACATVYCTSLLHTFKNEPASHRVHAAEALVATPGTEQDPKRCPRCERSLAP